MELNLKNSLRAADFAGKVAIFEMDGVLMPFRFNGHITPSDGAYHITPEEFDAGIIKQAVPSEHLSDIISSIDVTECYAMTNTVYNGEYDQRVEWLEEHFPKIKDLLISQNGRTAEFAIADKCIQREHQPLTKEDIIIICSDIGKLNYLEYQGYNVWHVSSLMDFYKHS